MSQQGQKMYLSGAFLLLCLPGCFTLSISRILKGTVGETLVMKCQYGAGEEGHRKFWCRGPDWRDCIRVIETAHLVGQEVRRGRVTLRDSPTEHIFLVIIEDLEEGDADTYWCGVDRSVPWASVAVTVFPGSLEEGSVTVAMRTTETSASTGALALTSHVSSPGLPPWPFLLSASFLFLVLLKAVLFLSFSYAAIWLAWLQRPLEGHVHAP
ncbi:CMRF35-like molecule 8 [Camelus dromedarius]|uniref:CMRF35-like molecule 8 n=1 Tax=Camelus dromedarius TaxID=9838 RepID=A0A5N4D372_CAMDR|nr:CMRF35-like molecule 8 [Camelus dromedarius]